MSSMIYQMEHRQTFSFGDVKHFDFTKSLPLIKELSDQTFYIFKATTLTQVDLDEDSLIFLQNKLVKRIPSCSSVVLTILDNQRHMPESLKVEVILKNRSSYKCIFASVSCKDRRRKKLIRLPLLCVLSGISMSESVHSAFESTFGCIITSICINRSSSCWLLGILINEYFRRELITDFSLIYKVKADYEISCNLPFGELYHFWTDCISSNSNKLDMIEIKAFMNKFVCYFERTYGVKVSMFEIISMVLKETSLTFKNKVEIKSNLAPLLYCILSYIESDLAS